MADPIISKTAAQAVTPKTELGRQDAEKEGPSKFDQIRDQLQGAQSPGATQLPPPVTQVSAQDKKILEGQLRRKLDANPAGNAQDVLKVDMRTLKSRVETLQQKAQGIPSTPEYGGIQQRLASIDQQFQASSEHLQNLKGSSDPRQMLQLQMEMYQLTQNVEVMSKVVEQVNSGVKQVLQTQV